MNLYIQLNPDRTVGLLSPVNLRKKVAKPKTNCNSNETYTKSCEILCSITYSKSAKIKLLEHTVFLFF